MDFFVKTVEKFKKKIQFFSKKMLKVKKLEIGSAVTAPYYRNFYSRVTPRPPLRGVLIHESTTISKLFGKNTAKTQKTLKIENIAKN